MSSPSRTETGPGREEAPPGPIPEFEFAGPGRIVFGPGAVRRAGELAAGLGRRCCLVAGGSEERSAPLREDLRRAGIEHIFLRVRSEPTVELAEELAGEARAAGCDLVIGFGGGSVIDSAKAVAASLAHPGRLLDYLEVIGEGRKLENPLPPVIAVPTTAGTGSEATRNAVLLSPAHRVKVSLRSPSLIPRIALVDPELTLSLPPGLTAATGLDALTQLVEPFVSPKATPLTDAVCREGLANAARSMERACRDGGDPGARAGMALAALAGGLALANAGLGAVHGLAGPLGGIYPAPHGAVCGRLLPEVMAANLRALESRAPSSPARERYRQVAVILTGQPEAEAADGVRRVRRLVERLEIPPLSGYGLTPAGIPEVVMKAKSSSSMKGNPIALTGEELAEILSRAL